MAQEKAENALADARKVAAKHEEEKQSKQRKGVRLPVSAAVSGSLTARGVSRSTVRLRMCRWSALGRCEPRRRGRGVRFRPTSRRRRRL